MVCRAGRECLVKLAVRCLLHDRQPSLARSSSILISLFASSSSVPACAPLSPGVLLYVFTSATLRDSLFFPSCKHSSAVDALVKSAARHVGFSDEGALSPGLSYAARLRA